MAELWARDKSMFTHTHTTSRQMFQRPELNQASAFEIISHLWSFMNLSSEERTPPNGFLAIYSDLKPAEFSTP